MAKVSNQYIFVFTHLHQSGKEPRYNFQTPSKHRILSFDYTIVYQYLMYFFTSGALCNIYPHRQKLLSASTSGLWYQKLCPNYECPVISRYPSVTFTGWGQSLVRTVLPRLVHLFVFFAFPYQAAIFFFLLVKEVLFQQGLHAVAAPTYPVQTPKPSS